jgi:leader peptidase (prepilin peptidase) / N-methyltransferase
MAGLDWTLLLRSPVFEVYALLLGLVVGSFANVCIHRLPAEFEPAPGRLGFLRDLARQALSVVHPPSRCPRCHQPIRWYDNVPLVSWIALRARCRSCGLPIPARYPAVEAANGLLWLALAVLHGPRPRTAVEMVFVTALLVLVIVDLEHQLLPDAITLPGALVAFLASFLPGSPVDPLESGLAAGLGYVAFAALAWAWRRLRGVEALGEGDWKMAAMLGALLGAERLMLVLLIASSAGALVGLATILLRRGGWQSKLPFGTFLGLAAILVVYAGEPVLRVYRGFFRG